MTQLKKHLLTLMLLLLPVAAMSQGSLYKQYAQRSDLKVGEVDGFKLNDSVRVDVVMLQAEDDAAWQRLCAEFDIRGTQTSVSWLASPTNPVQRVKWTGKPVLRVIASHKRHTIGIYRIDNELQYEALIDYQLNATMGKNAKMH
jgi:hypothetical protein